jgi:hypothetical protein
MRRRGVSKCSILEFIAGRIFSISVNSGSKVENEEGRGEYQHETL